MGAGGRTGRKRRQNGHDVFREDFRQKKARRKLRHLLGECITRNAVASGGGVMPGALHAKSRSRRSVAETRQLGMYLIHTLFSANLSRTGLLFGRDRTTVRHACARIEDRRDSGTLARTLHRLEPALTQWAERFAAIAQPEKERR